MRLAWSRPGRISRRFVPPSIEDMPGSEGGRGPGTAVRLKVIAILLGVACVLVGVGPGGVPEAAAHGEHGDAAPALQGLAVVQVAGYEVELLSNPAPLVAGQPAKIVAAVREVRTARARSGGRVFIGLAPATRREPKPEPDELLGHFFQSPGATPPADSAFHNPHSAIVMVRAREEAWAGNYVAQFWPERRGAYTVRVELRELNGRRIISPEAPAGPGLAPAVVNFHIEVAPPPPLFGVTFLWVGFVVVVAMTGGWVLRVRARLRVPDGARLNVLQVPWVRRAFAGPWLQPILQVPLLLLAVLLVLLGFGDTQDPARNLATPKLK